MGAKRTAVTALKLNVCVAILALAIPSESPLAAAASEQAERTPVFLAAAPYTPELRHVRRVALRKSKNVAVGPATSRSRHRSPRLSVGEGAGLRRTPDTLDLKSSAALVIDQETSEVLVSKNADAVLPIASLTKLMTALVIAEAKIPLDELLTVSQDDVDTEKGSRSRLKVGTQLTRGEMLHLALMASENRAAHTLGRTFPGGSEAFVEAMNAKGKDLGMGDSIFVESTGLSSRNRSSARDLATLVRAAHLHPIIRELSISRQAKVEVGRRNLQFHTTNRLVLRSDWDIGLQKTGYISEAGRCLVMQVNLAGRSLILVFLDSAGKHSRLGDAERVRRWVNQNSPSAPAQSTGPSLTS
jgi:serine-type D-Ala-D-Ala endopeptidase (penicillin-binding protein 7)